MIQGKDLNGKVVSLKASHPHQLSLFQTFLPPEDEKYSNTIELYDAIPKYFPLKKMDELRVQGKYLDTLTRVFEHRGKEYIVKIRPAMIETEQGEKAFYPSFREELVEEAIRKIACDRLNGVYLNNFAGVQFTLYELRKELSKRGRSKELASLIQSLKICNLSNISVETHDGKVLIQSALFPTIIISSRHEWLKNPKGTRCYVQFNPLVTACIDEISFRQYDYSKCMEYKHQLSRWFHKRLSHNYIQASRVGPPFRIKMSTILRDSGTFESDKANENIQKIEQALNELQKKDVLWRYERGEELRGKRRKIIDIIYAMEPSDDFISEVKKANARTKRFNQNFSENGYSSPLAVS
jgi:hypothetical protein